MKTKKFLRGVTFVVGVEMYEAMKSISDQREISLSELLREWAEDHLNTTATLTNLKEKEDKVSDGKL